MDHRINEIRRHVRGILEEHGSHGMDHTERVFSLCLAIGREEDASLDVLLPAALLHDIARPLEKEKGLPHEREGARMAGEYLAAIGYSPELIPAIQQAIRTHRFQSAEKPESLEAQILSDADKLDAMGAIGIARTFLRAGEHNGGIEDAVAHFHEKLLNLTTRMYTKTGQEIAAGRHAVLVRFLDDLTRELGHPPQ